MTPECVVMLAFLKAHPGAKGAYPWPERRACMIQAIVDQTGATYCPPILYRVPVPPGTPPGIQSQAASERLRPDIACLAKLESGIGRALDRAHATLKATQPPR